MLTFAMSCAGLEGRLRLEDGQSGPGYEYGRLEIFLRGLWTGVCDASNLTPDAALVACKILGFDGGAALQFRSPYSFGSESQVTALMF